MSAFPQIPGVGMPPVAASVGIPAAAAVNGADEVKEVSFANVSEFNAHLKAMCNAFDALNMLADKIHDVKAGEAPPIDKATLRSMRTDFKNQIKDLKKHFGTKSKRARKTEEADGTPKVPRRSGFDTPTYVSPHMIAFFTQNAQHLGLDPKTRQQLANLLNCLRRGLTTSTILTDLWAIYAIFVESNKLNVKASEVDAKGKPKIVSYYRADDNMRRCFGPTGSNTFLHLASAAPKVGKNHKIVQPFNPDRFQYITFQSIFSHNRLLSAEKPGAFHLNPAQQASLNAMNAWLQLTKVAPEALPADKRKIYDAVVSGQLAPGTTAEEVKLIQQCVDARRELAELEAEQKIVTDAHAAYKTAAEAAAPPKKAGGRGKRAPAAVVVGGVPVVNAPVGLLPVTNGAYTAVPRLQ